MKLKVFSNFSDSSIKYMLSLKKFSMKDLICDRSLAILMYQGEVYTSENCHQDILNVISDEIEDENDLIFVSMFTSEDESNFVLIHADYYFTHDDVELLRQEFNCPIYYEQIVDNESWAFTCS